MTKAVTHTMPITVVRARERTNLKTCYWHALLINTQAVIPTSRTLWCQARVNIVNTQVNQSCSARNDPSSGVDEGVRQDRHGLHPELQPLVEVLAVQHPAPDVVGHTRDVGLVEAVVPAVAVSASFSVLFVTLIIRLLARWAPKKPALVGMCAACSLVAEGLPNLARYAIHLENIFWAEFRGPRAVLGQITLVLREPAHRAWQLRFACFEVAAFPRGTGGVREQFTCVWIAAWIVTMLF